MTYASFIADSSAALPVFLFWFFGLVGLRKAEALGGTDGRRL